MVRPCLRSRNLVIEEVLAHWGAVAPKKERKKESHVYNATSPFYSLSRRFLTDLAN